MKQLIIFFSLLAHQSFCQQFHFVPVASVPNASFRGLSVVNDSIVWVGGSKGLIGKSTNGGNDWTFKQVSGYEQCDFRSVYAFDSGNAVIASAGIPAVILRTSDGGSTWKTVHMDSDTAAFFDGIGFWNKTDGVVYGDPVNGRLEILHTSDGGITWKGSPASNRPVTAAGEASFAASGTTLRCYKTGKMIIATGGTVSRLLVSADKGNSWKYLNTPILQGKNSTGIFSFSFINDKKGIIVGGDYQRDTLKTSHVFYTTDGGKTWSAPVTATAGYRECIEYVTGETVLAAGPTGTDISYDGGLNWQPITGAQGFHVLKKSRNGSLIIAAGSGKIAIGKW